MPLETAGGTKVVVAPTGPTSAVVVENRQPLGFDSSVARPGPLVYYIDTSVLTGEGVIKVLPNRDTDVRLLGALLSVGQTLTHANVSVKYVSNDSAAATVQITRP